MANYRPNPPDPYMLMDSMRSIGYSFESAICDIIDNSLSARATKIWLLASPDPANPYIGILDNGCGMTSDELYKAMRYGNDKSIKRDAYDLGRFGLGLKSASLSQCRVLTVLSKKNGEVCGYSWDEDHIKETRQWEVLEFSIEECEKEPFFDLLNSQEKGTLVLWKNFDVLRKESGKKFNRDFTSKLASVSEKIRLVYHRFMGKETSDGPKVKTDFFFNGRKLEPLDPFLRNNPQTRVEKAGIISEADGHGCTHQITIQPFILPFQKTLSEEDMEMMGGVQKMISMQGFYIYRNYRLINYGTWFGMNPKNELSKYARIMIDIPTALDDIWGIDVKKEKATIPSEVKPHLEKLLDASLEGSKRRVKKRILTSHDKEEQIWATGSDRDGKVYIEINQNNPFVQSFYENLSEEGKKQFKILIKAISQSIPYTAIYSFLADQAITTAPTDNEQMALCRAEALVYLRQLTERDPNVERCISKVVNTEPYSLIPEIERFLRQNNGGKRNE